MKTKKKKKELPEILPIDLNNLEIEWVDQPQLCSAYCDALAQAELDHDELKSEIELAAAEVELVIRSTDPSKYGLEKYTEGAIKSIIISTGEYRILERKLQKLTHIVRLLKGNIKTIDQRLKALGKLVDLHGQEYFSVPRVSSQESKEKMKDVEKRNIRKGAKRKNTHSGKLR